FPCPGLVTTGSHVLTEGRQGERHLDLGACDEGALAGDPVAAPLGHEHVESLADGHARKPAKITELALGGDHVVHPQTGRGDPVQEQVAKLDVFGERVRRIDRHGYGRPSVRRDPGRKTLMPRDTALSYLVYFRSRGIVVPSFRPV